MVLALLRAAGWRPPALVEFGSATLLAMISGNGPMTVLGITDPRSWSASGWLSDVIPHLAYGAVVSATLRRVIR